MGIFLMQTEDVVTQHLTQNSRDEGSEWRVISGRGRGERNKENKSNSLNQEILQRLISHKLIKKYSTLKFINWAGGCKISRELSQTMLAIRTRDTSYAAALRQTATAQGWCGKTFCLCVSFID